MKRFFAALALATCAPVAAQDDLFGFAIPRTPFEGDRIGIPVYQGDGCYGPYYDEAMPSVRLVSRYVSPDGNREYDVYQYELEYRLVPPSQSPICGVPPPPGFGGYFDAGALPLGVHEFQVRGYADDALFVEYRVPGIWVRRVHALPADVSGAWMPQGQPGRGVFVTRGAAFGLFWATHDLAGKPTWLAMSTTVGDFDSATRAGAAVATEGVPFAQGITPAMNGWGTLEFQYLGCKRARLAWQSNDPAYGSGSVSLTQVLQADDTPKCDPTPEILGPPLPMPIR